MYLIIYSPLVVCLIVTASLLDDYPLLFWMYAIIIIVICIKTLFNNMYGISYFDLSLLTLRVWCGLCVSSSSYIQLFQLSSDLQMMSRIQSSILYIHTTYSAGVINSLTFFIHTRIVAFNLDYTRTQGAHVLFLH